MIIRVLGSAAGGGYPQWNCNCRNCHGLRQGTIRATARSQSSLAVSQDGEKWLLINASPDIRSQIENYSMLHPRHGVRDTGLAAVLLMDSQIDHTSGLIFLREHTQPISLYCTEAVYQDLNSGFNILQTISQYCGVEYHNIATDQEAFSIPELPGLTLTPIPIVSNAPPYSLYRNRPRLGHTIALAIKNEVTGKSLVYAPDIGKVDETIYAYLAAADCILVDGTFWHDDDMKLAGCGDKTASSMGHLPLSGENGMLELLSSLEKPRKILTHINNTNPILDEDSQEHQEVLKRSIEISYDGMQIEL